MDVAGGRAISSQSCSECRTGKPGRLADTSSGDSNDGEHSGSEADQTRYKSAGGESSGVVGSSTNEKGSRGTGSEATQASDSDVSNGDSVGANDSHAKGNGGGAGRR